MQIVTSLDNRKIFAADIHRFFNGLENTIQDTTFFDCTNVLHDRACLDQILGGVCFEMVGSNAIVLYSVHDALTIFLLATSLELDIYFYLQSLQHS